MMRNICILASLLLVLPAVCGQTSALRHVTFTRYREWKPWKDAQSFCREKHLDLATVTDEEENRELGSVGYWTGLHRKDGRSPWKWSRGDETATFFSWGRHEPHGHQHCGGKLSGKWENDDCETPHTFTCSDEHLVLVKQNKTWEEALDHCRSLAGGASAFWKHRYDLATLISDDDHEYARETAGQATTDEVWTGLRFLGDGWFWVGGEPVQYQDLPSCPAFGCGVLEKDGSTSFRIRACSQRRNFFCYKRPENS